MSEPRHISSTDSISAARRPRVSPMRPNSIGADRPHEEAEREDARGRHHLRDGVVAWKESVGEIKRKGGIDVKVIPFDEIADRSDEYGPQAHSHIV